MPAPNRFDTLSFSNPGPQPSPNDREAADGDVLAELRKDVAAIVGDLKTIVERRAAEAGQTVYLAAGETREVIRSHPLAAIGVAILLGAGLARLIVPARQARSPYAMPAWASLQQMPAHLMQTTREFPASVAHSNTFASLASTLERVVEQISTLDPKSQLSPALEKAGALWNGLRTSLGGK
jgi:ElaB/YqjD/DUF883 family membrane-anchored ribosome-binding protein